MEDDIKCSWCGNEPATDEHHLFRRSTNPQLKEDANNIIRLGPNCHKYATENREFEVLLQEYFFLKPEVKLSVENIAKFMREKKFISPRDTVRFRNYLAGQFQFISARFSEIITRKPSVWGEIRETAKSTNEANTLYDVSPDGVEIRVYRYELDAIEKMLSALRSILEQYQTESRNMF